MEEIQFEELMKDNTRMIYSIINDIVYKDFVSDYRVCEDDLFQEGCIALYNAFLTYDCKAGAKFSTYAYLLIRRRLIHKLREYIRPIMFEKYSYDAVREVDYLSYFTFNETSFRQRSSLPMIEEFCNTLSEEEKELVRKRKNKESYKEISASTGLSEKQIDNRLAKIKRKYRRYLEKEKELTNGSSYPEHYI